MYFGVVWTLVVFGSLILLAGLDQPLVLLVISACMAAVTMFVYSILLAHHQPPLPARPDQGPLATALGALIFAGAFFGVLSAITIVQQVGDLI